KLNDQPDGKELALARATGTGHRDVVLPAGFPQHLFRPAMPDKPGGSLRPVLRPQAHGHGLEMPRGGNPSLIPRNTLGQLLTEHREFNVEELCAVPPPDAMPFEISLLFFSDVVGQNHCTHIGLQLMLMRVNLPAASPSCSSSSPSPSPTAT